LPILSLTNSAPDTFTGPKGDFAIPTLQELGYPAPTTTIHGGETIGRARLAAFNDDDQGKRAALFEKPKTSPAVPGPLGTLTPSFGDTQSSDAGVSESENELEEGLGPSIQVDVSKPSTTLMSPYLKFGCVGVRECWWSWHDILV
jgi:cryptochrome